MKKIPLSNYFKLGIIVVAVVVLAFVCRHWYINKTNYELNIPIINKTLINEVNSNEIYNYILENENSVIYMGVASDIVCREFEDKFDDVILNMNLTNKITYLNISNLKNRNKFIKEFNEYFNSNVNTYPSIIVFREGEVKDIITITSETSINQVIDFLNNNSINNLDL